MNKKFISTIGLLLTFVIYIFVYQFFLLQNLLKYVEFINAAFVLFITFWAFILLGFREDKKTQLKKNVILLTVMVVILFFSLSYGIGLFIGFLRNSYSLDLHSIIDNIFAPIIMIICIEMFRYIAISANKERKIYLIIITLVIAAFEIFTSIRLIDLDGFARIFKISTSIIFPIIVKNMVLSYLTYEVGYRPSLIYRLVMDVYIFVMPIIPDFGEYINSMIGICFPVFLYVYAARMIEEYHSGVQYDFSTAKFEWTDLPVVCFILIFVGLLSGQFSYFIIGIGSGSMAPVINKGDAVIIQKIKEDEALKEGDIIAFSVDGKTVIHRLVDIERVGSKYMYHTKGDANNSEDKLALEFSDIKGKVNLRIPYVAYPSLFLS